MCVYNLYAFQSSTVVSQKVVLVNSLQIAGMWFAWILWARWAMRMQWGF